MTNRLSLISTPLVTLGLVWSAQAGTPLTTIRVASGLSNPIFVTHAPGDYERLFILEQRGRIRILKGGQVLSTSFLDISTQVSLGGEQGLLGLAFHPDFANNRQFYINYTDNAGDTVVARYTASESDPDRADPDGDTILFVGQPFSNHNGGWIDFGPDGYLYIALGDGGDQGDPNNRGQSITGDLLGNILRIDVNQDSFPADELRDYRIPTGNPFIGRTGEDEIWAYGLRNPWRNSFDSETGDLWIADVGEGMWEEVNFQPASSLGGENYGWDCREGTQCTTFGNCSCTSLPTKLPIHVYSHGTGDGHCSITGGVVYRGCEIPDLDGTYFFADFCSGQIWSLTYNGSTASVINRTAELTPASPLAISSISSFGTDAAGEIYICDRAGLTGEVYKIVPASGAPQLIGSDPLDGVIDARTPLASNGITKVGINKVILSFNQPTRCTSTDYFRVEQQGVAGTPPSVSSVQVLPNNAVQVNLSRPVDPLAWTTVTHEPTQSAVRFGFLPGDVNSDGVTAPVDILALIDSLNAVGPVRQIWSTDLDRSGLTTPSDLIKLIDILNGAGNLDSYNGARLP